MSTATEQARRRRKAPTASVRIEEEIARQSDVIAATRQIERSDYLSDKLREVVQRDYDAAVREMQRDAAKK
jgi:hypothetical protein